MIKVVMQKNVNIHTKPMAFSTTYKGLFEFLSKEAVEKFIFSPSQDQDELKMIAKRVKIIEKAGYIVTDNDELYYYKTAIKA